MASVKKWMKRFAKEEGLVANNKYQKIEIDGEEYIYFDNKIKIHLKKDGDVGLSMIMWVYKDSFVNDKNKALVISFFEKVKKGLLHAIEHGYCNYGYGHAEELAQEKTKIFEKEIKEGRWLAHPSFL